MLRSAGEVLGYKLIATDGSIGNVYDMSFDERTATIRYVVANTGGWLSDRLVLLSTASFGPPDWRKKAIPVALTKEQIENSPTIDADKTVSQHHETELHKYYGWPAYWAAYLPPGTIGFIPERAGAESVAVEEDAQESCLRSVREVTGYHIQAADGEIGHVDDFIFEDDGWVIRYVVVDTRNWLPGRKVLLSPAWVRAISWDERKVQVDLSREQVRNGPEYDPAQPVNREYESRLYDYYGRPKYW